MTRLPGARITTSDEAFALFAPTFDGGDIEELRVAHLDGERRLIALRHYMEGGPTMLELPLRAIIAEALVLGSHGLLLAHNHPSGDPSPSGDDIAATRALAELAARLDIRLYDHLIFAGGHWRSFRALGLL